MDLLTSHDCLQESSSPITDHKVLYSQSFIRIILVAVFAVLFVLQTRAHDGHTAAFTLSAAKNMVELEVNVRSNEFADELDNHSDCDADMDQAVCAVLYLQKHFKVVLNGEEMDLLYISSVENDKNTVYSFGILIDPSKVRSVSIRNTCFIFSEHSTTSIVNFNLASEVSYKMDRTRVEISHRF